MTGIDKMVDDIREKMISTNPGLTKEVVTRITNECHARPAWCATTWVAWLVSRAKPGREKETLNSIIALCSGLRFMAKKQKSTDPKDYDDILMFTLISTPWDALPEMRVLTAMLKASVMVAEAWRIE